MFSEETLDFLRTIAYPGLAATTLAQGYLSILWYRRTWHGVRNQERRNLGLALYFFITAVVNAMLGLTTGIAPVYDLPGFTAWILLGRLAALVVLIGLNTYTALRLWRNDM